MSSWVLDTQIETHQLLLIKNRDPCQSVALRPSQLATLEQTLERARTSLRPTQNEEDKMHKRTPRSQGTIQSSPNRPVQCQKIGHLDHLGDFHPPRPLYSSAEHPHASMWAGDPGGPEKDIFHKTEPCSLDDYCAQLGLYSCQQGLQQRQIR